MPNTYTQIHIQAVFAVKYRKSLIRADWEDKLYKYITGIVQNHQHKMLCINGMPDHIHLFFGMRPSQSLSDLMKAVKGESSEWINKEGFTDHKFSWQGGYGAFSYTKAHVPRVIRYVQNQKIHHGQKSFREEYLDLLKQFGIEFDERFIFKPLE